MEGRPSLGSPCCKGMTVDDFDINGDYDVTFNQGKVDVTTDYQMGGQNIFMISSRDYFDQVGEDGYEASPIGTGPFTFLGLQDKPVHLCTSGWRDHWRKTPEFPELQIFYVLEDATRMAMLLTNEAHIAAVAQSLMPTVVERGYLRVPSTNPSFALVTIIGGLYYEGRARPERADDGRAGEGGHEPGHRPGYHQPGVLRRASRCPCLCRASSPSRTSTSGTRTPTIPDQGQGLCWRRRDIRRASTSNSSLAKMPGIPEAPEIGEAMAPYFQEIGLRPHIRETNFGDLATTYRTKDARNKILLFRGSAVADFQWIRAIQGAPYGSINAPADEELVALTDAWEMLVDADARKQATQAIGDWFYNYYWAIPLFWVRAEVAVNPGIVADYTSDQIHFGPSRHHEFTVPVYQ